MHTGTCTLGTAAELTCMRVGVWFPSKMMRCTTVCDSHDASQVRILRMYRSEDYFTTRRIVFPQAFRDHALIDDFLVLMSADEVQAGATAWASRPAHGGSQRRR